MSWKITPKGAVQKIGSTSLLEGKIISAKEKGAIHFNIAVCHRRLGKDLLATYALKEGLQYAPKLAKQARKDKDLLELFENKEYAAILDTSSSGNESKLS